MIYYSTVLGHAVLIMYLLNQVILAPGSSHVKQSVSSHVDDVDAGTTIDEHIQQCTVPIHSGIVHRSEPMLVSAGKQ